MELHKLKLMTTEEIRRRLTRMVGKPFVMRTAEITRIDAAKWIGVDVRLLRSHTEGREPISDSMQIVYSRFFAMVDAGELALVVHPKTRKKALMRVERPATPPKKQIMPRIDISTMRLKLE